MSIRNEIQKILEESGDSVLSGNELAERLGVSRAAVWKAIGVLREEGFQIEAVHKTGYRLRGDALSAEGISVYLKDRVFWKDIQVFDEVSSTNITAKELAEKGADSGTAILAERQTAGKGRLGRSFFSPARSGVYLTVILRLPQGIEDSMLITSAAAVAVCRAIRTVTGLEAQIKWVNDVYYEGKKLCGILAEAAMNVESRTLDYVVVGMGVNVTAASFPPELQEIATSLETALGDGQPISRCRLAAEMMNEIQSLSGELSGRGFLNEYRALSCILGQEIDVIAGGVSLPGRALDINENGNLIVEMPDGEIRTLSSGEISVRRRNIHQK